MRIGIFGGTFDPPHLGHLIAAQDAHAALALDRLVFVPAARPPHKRDRMLTDGATRLRLVEAALQDDDRFEADDLELRRDGPSYTVDTLRAFHTRHPGAELILLVGADQFQELHSWHEAAEVRRLAVIGVLEREGAAVDGTQGGAEDGRVRHVPVTRIDVSSTDIRRRIDGRQPIRYLVPAAVERLILDLGLYGRNSGEE
ncbi:MAG: nicotinate-nucleotide adenylyltransferase [Longimicrobiales bacterium]